jgi:predicted RNA-binding Zn-ribbon protein involved in translation (DUF1610 family)
MKISNRRTSMQDTGNQTAAPMSKFTLTALHRAFGEVTFTLDAKDKKHAFSQFKSIVAVHTQWVITSNIPHAEAPCPGCGDAFAWGCRVCNGVKPVQAADLVP